MITWTERCEGDVGERRRRRTAGVGGDCLAGWLAGWVGEWKVWHEWELEGNGKNEKNDKNR